VQRISPYQKPDPSKAQARITARIARLRAFVPRPARSFSGNHAAAIAAPGLLQASRAQDPRRRPLIRLGCSHPDGNTSGHVLLAIKRLLSDCDPPAIWLSRACYL